jgi:RimJ/RimL family protein N-acetyltransferase
MNIKGERIILRAIEEKDCPLLLDLINDQETEFMLGGWSFPVSQQMQIDWISNLAADKHTLRCIIESTLDHNAVGTIILSDIDYKNGNAEVQIKISDNGHRGKGYGFDAISTVVRYAFSELRLKCIYATVSDHNIASLKLFSKCGFTQEGVLRKRLFKRGKFIDIVVLSILND